MNSYLSSTFFPPVRFDILSLGHYDAEDVHSFVPITMEYEVFVTEMDYH